MSYYERVPRAQIVELVGRAHSEGTATLEIAWDDRDAWVDALYERAESVAGDMCAIAVTGEDLPSSYKLSVTWCA